MHLKTIALGMGVLGVLAAGALSPTGTFAQTSGLRAKATIAGEGIAGTVTFREVDAHTKGLTDSSFGTGLKGVEIAVDVTGLKPGAHGIHIHAVGKCEPPGFTTAGGHFDPGPAGNMDPDMNHPYHMGDLPNLVADAKGHATMTVITTRVTLGPGPLTLFDADGSAIIIHANPDQGVTGEAKSGLSGGPRLACGVIEKQ
jgi:Cu-Zn family superoxide dismutase